MKTAVKTRDYSWAYAATKQVAIALGFALAYILMTLGSPIPAKSAPMGMLFGKVIRFANVLRAFILITPAAFVGTMVGSLWLNRMDGWVGFTKWAVAFSVGLVFLWLIPKVGRGHIKDVLLMGAYGATTSLAMAIVPAYVFMVLSDGLPAEFTSIMLFRAIGTALVYMLGAEIVRAYEFGLNKWRTHGTRSATE